ncbi:efflux RND transporter periplasmic adaptor subunit [Rhodopirellula halodulae]|uniref:efflux RND transporter periplasmic adaptor subunit n=1 Tax=Rhodopirellula halodulae TaxID=2894198 RepID=UPI001E3CD403|nr:HlyD family efflux transporter periplasmic adaptor subunit [Rhodopirellula sp. JC737]MCC9654453.1 HlyD family efflux transporter periplasmic adaptor subunit [Rhodopirellula sp. JC737]
MNTWRLIFAAMACIGTALISADLATAQTGSATDPSTVSQNCSVKFIRKVDIPAEVEGKLVELPIEEGMSVSKGDLLALVDDTSARLALEFKKAEEKEAQLNAANEVNLKDARNNEELARAEAESFRELYEKGATPYYEMKKKVLEAIRALLRIDLAEMQKKIAEAQYIAKRSEREIAEFELDRRRITALFDGYIEMRIAQLGEWVQPGSPIATLVQLDRLRVVGDISAIESNGMARAGAPVVVRVFNSADPDQDYETNAQLGFVSSEVDGLKRYRIWVDIDNRKDSNGNWMVKPGMDAEIIFQ